VAYQADVAHHIRSRLCVRQPVWQPTSWLDALVKAQLKSTTTSLSVPSRAWELVKALVTHWALNSPGLLLGLGTALTTTMHCQPLNAAHVFWAAGSTNSSGAKILPS